MARVFKAKYFPIVDFFGVNLGHKPSLIWYSIHVSHVVVKVGLRWRVEDGRNINVWQDAWLKDQGSSCYKINHFEGRKYVCE